jgi:hypothetical protein
MLDNYSPIEKIFFGGRRTKKGRGTLGKAKNLKCRNAKIWQGGGRTAEERGERREERGAGREDGAAVKRCFG